MNISNRVEFTRASPQIAQDQELEEHKRRRATLAVAAHAHNAEDCKELLRALGLLPPGHRWKQSTKSGHPSARELAKPLETADQSDNPVPGPGFTDEVG